MTEITRRSFLKLGGAAAAVWGLRALGLGFLLGGTTSCGPGLSSPEQLRQQSFDPETVIFNGKTVSLNSLDIKTIQHVDKTKLIVSGIKDLSKSHDNPEGYKGNPLPENWEIDYERTAIVVNETESGDLISQVFLSRKKVDEYQEDGRYGWEQFVNGLANAGAYSKHSLVVVGPKDYYCFDNVESETDQGRTRVTVDGRTGKIYQITENSPNSFEKLFKKEEVTMSIEEIDVLKNESAFHPTLTPINPGFINHLNIFIQNGLRPDLTEEEKMEAVNIFLSGSRLSWWDESTLRKFLKPESSDSFIAVLKKFNFDIPFDRVELPIIHSVLSKKIKQFIDVINNNQTDFDGSVSESISNSLPDIPQLDDFNINTLKKLLSERVTLPMSSPELYLVKAQNEEGDKWFLVGKYQISENDVDETIWTSQPDAYSAGEKWYTFGEISRELVESSSLRQYEIQISNFPYDDIKNKDRNSNQPLTGSPIGGLFEMIETRKIDPEAISFLWNPEERKIKPALVVADKDNKPRAMILSYDRFLGDQIDNLPYISNRVWLPGFGYSPTVLKDVTEDVIDLNSKGFKTTSLFLLDPMADFSLIANFTSETGGFLDYTNLQQQLTPEAFESFIQPGEFLKGGADNSMLVMPKPGQENTIIHQYDKETGNKVGEVVINHPILISPKKIGAFLDDTNYIIVTEDDHTSYVVENEDTFPLGARSTEKLAAIAVGEIAAVIAAIYGGFRLIGKIPLLNNFLKETFKVIGNKILQPATTTIH